jgi:hypothetical protein
VVVVKARVTGLYALCDLTPREEYRAELVRKGWHVSAVDAAVKQFDVGLQFSVREFATLSQGHPVLLRELGWTSVPSKGGADALAAYLTEELILNGVRNVVMPDDAEGSVDEHPWKLLAETLVGIGFPTTASELEGMPYEIRLTPRLRARLTQ